MTILSKTILVINAGSSSIKFSLFKIIPRNSRLILLFRGAISVPRCNDQQPCKAKFVAFAPNHKEVCNQDIMLTSCDACSTSTNYNLTQSRDVSHSSPSHTSTARTHYQELFIFIFDWLNKNLPKDNELVAVGHRVVHGGLYLFTPTLITNKIIKQIEDLIPLAPLHQGHNLDAIKIIAKHKPSLMQIACFDTAFHHEQTKLARLFAIPNALTNEGIMRYGFHGISYEYIASTLLAKIGSIANKRVIVAHLGNGASMCAMYKRKSVATSMGFTALDGLMMGSRCGNIDPGVVLYLLEEKRYSLKQVNELLYQQSGLLGVSGISNDLKILLTSNTNSAQLAIDLFCYKAALELGALQVALGGCDVLIFTAGIGENSPLIRSKICNYLKPWGLKLNNSINNNLGGNVIISAQNSKILVAVIPTDEERMIAKHACRLL